tara:strand:- start:133 stop:891 length:759 start_codon:yes stop_codon:yes gene_type:complete
MITLKYDWEFNTMDIYNYQLSGPYDSYFNFIRKNHDHMKGDILESGVFRGRTLIATALLLKELGSNKIIYGYDSFNGFPSAYDEEDQLNSFKMLFQLKKISQDHLNAVNKNLVIKKNLSRLKTNSSNISKSGDFSDTSKQLLETKIKLLGLDNIKLVEGVFSETMIKGRGPDTIFACMLDCDLYKSYLDTLNFVWPKLNIGGLIQLDEYYSLKFPGARFACDEFFANKKINLFKSKNSLTDQFERWSAIKLV